MWFPDFGNSKKQIAELEKRLRATEASLAAVRADRDDWMARYVTPPDDTALVDSILDLIHDSRNKPTTSGE